MRKPVIISLLAMQNLLSTAIHIYERKNYNNPNSFFIKVRRRHSQLLQKSKKFLLRWERWGSKRIRKGKRDNYYWGFAIIGCSRNRLKNSICINTLYPILLCLLNPLGRPLLSPYRSLLTASSGLNNRFGFELEPPLELVAMYPILIEHSS